VYFMIWLFWLRVNTKPCSMGQRSVRFIRMVYQIGLSDAIAFRLMQNPPNMLRFAPRSGV
jgi:hypothetical protein